jgi:hypothetical protein
VSKYRGTAFWGMDAVTTLYRVVPHVRYADPGFEIRGFSFFIILSGKGHIIILEHAVGMIKLADVLRTGRYGRSIPYYYSYTRVKRNNNGSSVLARKIIIQSLICILIVFSLAYLQNSTEKLPRDIVSAVRTLLIEKHVSTEDLYQTLADAYRECVDYIKGYN